MDYIISIMHDIMEIPHRGYNWLAQYSFVIWVIFITVATTILAYLTIETFTYYINAQLNIQQRELRIRQQERLDWVKFECKHYETVYGWDYSDCLSRIATPSP